MIVRDYWENRSLQEYDTFYSGLAHLLEVMRTKEYEQGVLYSASELLSINGIDWVCWDTPVLRLPKCNTPVKEKLRRDEWSKGEETLKTCTSHLDQVYSSILSITVFIHSQILYPIVVGDDLAVTGSHQRKNSVTDLVTKVRNAPSYLSPSFCFYSWNSFVLKLISITEFLFGIRRMRSNNNKYCNSQ